MYWRAAGLNYVKFSSVAAQAVRNSLKGKQRTDAAKREGSDAKVTLYQDGKPIKAAA